MWPIGCSTLHSSTLYLEPGFLKLEPGEEFLKLFIGALKMTEKEENDNQYKLKKAMAITMA